MELGIKKGSGQQIHFGQVMPFPEKSLRKGLVAVLAVLLIVGAVLSPRYLLYSDLPRRSDIIVQFIGPDQESRRREAWQLFQEGYSKYLFIPTLFSLYKTNQDRSGLTAIRFSDINPGTNLPQPTFENERSITHFQKIRSLFGFPRFYEDTHAEILLAKRAMDACGFRSAIFVSSPYHMRRIKIISSRVFGSSYDIIFAASHFEKRYEVPLTLQQDLQHVFTEGPKIFWFLCYDLWDRWAG